MAFDDSAVTYARAERRGADLLVTWAGTLATGRVWQVYVDKVLAWSGEANSAVVPSGRTRGRIRVGSVLEAERLTSFAASLNDPGRRVTLRWAGGLYLAADVAEYRVYQGATPGADPNLSLPPVARVPAFPQGLTLDGFGLGRFGAGGFGSSAIDYEWTSGVLANGTWKFKVRPADAAGNEGTAVSFTAAVAGPPNPPPRNATTGARVAVSYNAGTGVATLSWSAST